MLHKLNGHLLFCPKATQGFSSHTCTFLPSSSWWLCDTVFWIAANCQLWIPFAILYLLSVSILAQLVRLLSVWKPNSPTVVLLCLFAHHLHPSGSTPGYRQLVHALGHLRHTVCTCSFRTQRIPLTTGAWLWWKKLHYFSFSLWHHLTWKLRTCVIVS